MFGLLAAVVATLWIVPETVAQDKKYTVWSSVIFARTGDRTPQVLGTIPTTLTSLGAEQQYNVGAYFRQRYIESFGSETGIDSAPIQGLSVDRPNVKQLYVNALDEQYTIASAQAFFQGFYPPYPLTGNTTEEIRDLDPTSLLANNSYVLGPLDNYQYPMIQSYSDFDPLSVYLAGNALCPAYDYAAQDYFLTPEYALIQAESRPIYQAVGLTLLSEVLGSPGEWDYYNAYDIYDYLNYQNIHNITFAQQLAESQFINTNPNATYLEMLGWYANEQAYAYLGNLYATNNVTSSAFPASQGSISTIAGNLFASKVLGQLQEAIANQGQYYKLSVLFGEFEPLMSFFALAGLPPFDSDFYGIPGFASVVVFELFSYTDASDATVFPSEDELWVRFWFRNGTDADQPFRSYALFGNDPSESDMTWSSFQLSMDRILVGDIGEWCSQCGAASLFCAYWNASDSIYGSSSSSSSGHGGVSPAVGGVIGAVVTLVVAGMIFGAVMLLGGVRLYRVKSHKSDMGGFKGSQKLASDKDLVLPKGGAVVGASVETPGSPVSGGHERVGSWELKHNEAGLPNIAAEGGARRPSFADDDVGDIGASPFQEPVKADERV